MVGMRVKTVLGVRDDDVRPDFTDLAHDLADSLVARQAADGAVRPVEPAQLLNAKMSARALQLSGAHLDDRLRGGAVVAEDRARLAARGADQHTAHAGAAVIGERRTGADLIIGMGEDT